MPMMTVLNGGIPPGTVPAQGLGGGRRDSLLLLGVSLLTALYVVVCG